MSDRVVHGNLDAVRNYLDVRDVVTAYQAAISAPSGVYNVCGGRWGTTTMRNVLDKLIEYSTAHIKTEQDQALYRPAPPVAFVQPSHAKLTRATGWKPEIALTVTLADILDDWRARL
jgi:GDP-4-dehydro-6-deoxy-D-mannose reductase